MSTADLKEKVTGVVERKGPPKSFPEMLERWLPQIAKALPKHVTPDRMSRMALTAFRRNPKLGECDPLSVFAAVMQSSQLGLEIDTLGRAYIVPYKVNKKTKDGWESHFEAQFIPGWKGLVDLMNRSGNGTVYTGVIFKDQKYDFRDGSTRTLEIFGETDLEAPTDITHFYAVGWVKGATIPIIEFWRAAKVRNHLNRYNKVGGKHYALADDGKNWEMYGRKIPLLQVLKYMPMSVELAKAIELDNAAASGEQGLNMENVIEGTWTPSPDSDRDESDGTDPAASTDSQKDKPKEEAMDVLTSINKLSEFTDIEKMSEFMGGLPDDVRKDDRVSKKFKEQMDAIKAK